VKITIEIDGSTVPSVQQAAEGSGAAQARGATAPAADNGVSLSALLEKAAALGAENAGAGPSLSGPSTGPEPVASSVGGAQSASSLIATSAGSPPPHVYESQGGCK
jgi:hypothetical protein